GVVGKTIGVLGDITGTKKLGEGLGYSLNNAMGGQEGLIQANNRNIDIQGQLIQQIKKMKSKGKDTTRLEKALKDLGMSIAEDSGKVSDVGTGGITNGQVLGSALQTGLTIASALSLIKSGIGLFTKGTPQAVLTALKNVGIKSPAAFEAFSNADKVELLTESLSKAGVAEKTV